MRTDHTIPGFRKRCVKSIFLIFVILNLSLPGLVMAQEEEKEQYGIKAGINYAELFGDDAIPESDRKVGYSLGAYMSFKLNKHLKLQPELIWSLQGEKSEKKDVTMYLTSTYP